MHMAKSGKARIVISVPRLVSAAILIGIFIGGTQFLPQPSQARPILTQPTASKSPVPFTAAPQTTEQPAPTPTPQATPATAPEPIAKVHVTHTVKSASVVKPSPSASVTGLQPVNPTPAPSTSSVSSSNTSGSVPATPLTTTAYTSSNWAGYFASSESYTGISGTWTVPTVTGVSRHRTSDAAWVGIGGVTSGDLIQVGTEDDVSRSGVQTSSAFYELLPAASISITSLQVSPGDVMTATLTEVSSGQWTININDTTTGKSYSNTVSYTSSLSSAEWIEEDPSTLNGTLVPFDHFGTVSFHGSAISTTSGTLSLMDSNAQPITLVSSTGPVASPSAIGADGKSFTITHL